MSTDGTRTALACAALTVGVAGVLVTGADHLDEYAVNHFSIVPTIGTLFLLDFIAATLVGVGLMLPLGRIAKHHATALRGLLALSGITIAATSLIGLWISENSRLFGFTEYGFRPTIIVAIVAESTAIVALIAYLYLRRPSSSSRVQSSSSTVSVSE